MDYITAFSDGLQLLLNNGKSNFISPAIGEATDRRCMIQIELALIILIKRYSLHPQQARARARRGAHALRRTLSPRKKLCDGIRGAGPSMETLRTALLSQAVGMLK